MERKITYKKTFEMEYFGACLQFELFEKKHIKKVLMRLQEKNRLSFECIEGNSAVINRQLKNEKQQPQYFSYIKFFSYEGTEYGLVGGKTTFKYPDVSFDLQKDNANEKKMARVFLKQHNAMWANEIIVVYHNNTVDKESDEQQALFIEWFLQRQFNLFDS